MDPVRGAAPQKSPQKSQPRKSQLVVDAVLARVRSGEWAVGSRLPSERDLSAQFQVSRAAVREALQVLQLSGRVRTWLGEGSFVAEPRGGTASDDAGLRAGMSIAEALEAREAAELASALLAIRRASRSDLLKLEAVVVELQEHLERGDFTSYLHSTLDLHGLVAEASHNAYLIREVTALTERHRHDQWLLHERYTPEVAAYSFELHSGLVAAIVGGDAIGVIDATTRHYENYPVLQAPDVAP